MGSSTQYDPIPQPPERMFGLLGNMPDMDPDFPMKNIYRLSELYGPIMKLNLDQPRYYVSTQALANEVSDEKRFHKVGTQNLEEVRALLGDGLFTAHGNEVNWAKAHRMLMPAFGPLGIRKMFDSMQDIASQMILRWDRLGPDNEIDASDDLTRLAFDTIGLCAFSFRFNQYYLEEAHPFARQMASVLKGSGRKAARPSWAQYLYRKEEEMRQKQVHEMWDLCDKIVADRKQHPQPDNHDLLHTMLNTVDRETGEGLSDENIRYQLATFLVAGHETTSATLSFTYVNLLKNPEKLLKAQALVDEVMGDRIMTLEDIPKLGYLDACIKETLRLSSPLAGITVASDKDELLAGKYFIPKGSPVMVLNTLLHRDVAVWGEDFEAYRPERFQNGGYENLPPNSWKPFGNGIRACIGRGFAEQEMIMNLAMVLQHFQLELADSNYELQIKSTLTIKPANFGMKARRRAGKDMYAGIPGGVRKDQEQKHGAASNSQQHSHSKPVRNGEKPMAIFWGGNSGTCEALAQNLESACKTQGYAISLASLDAATEHIPIDQPAVFIAASFEGQPSDNSKKFVSWLESLNPETQSLKGVQYAVYGVGNSDWPTTFHKVPKLVDELIAKNGGIPIVSSGFSDVKKDLVGPWDEWVDKLSPVLSDGASQDIAPAAALDVNITSSSLSRAIMEGKANYGTIIANRGLAGTEVGPAKRHIEVQLPEGVEYLAGDYMVVQPQNPFESMHRVQAFFGLDPHDMLSVKGSTKKHFPTEPILLAEFLSRSVELSTPITKKQLKVVASYAKADQETTMAKLLDEHEVLLSKRYSVLDVIEEHNIHLPFGPYVDMLQPLLPREYSISSSPLVHPDTVSLTIDVHESPALSGHGIFQGVCSSYLASRRVGDRITCYIKATNVGFRLPQPSTPIVMMAAGTGIAPMRAFLQERAAIAQAGTRTLGPAILYFGCRHESKDYIYKEQLAEWEKFGIVKIRTAFSKQGDHKSHYVPDLVWEDKDEVAEHFQNGGKIFLCGSAARLGKSVADTCKKIYMERTRKSAEEADAWLQSVKQDRYVSDVY